MVHNQIDHVVSSVLYSHIDPKDHFCKEGDGGMLINNMMEYVVKHE